MHVHPLGDCGVGEGFVLFPPDEGIVYEYICHLRDVGQLCRTDRETPARLDERTRTVTTVARELPLSCGTRVEHAGCAVAFDATTCFECEFRSISWKAS